MKGIEELGFTDLFPIQAQAIAPLLQGKDVIGQAQTGTGKTLLAMAAGLKKPSPTVNTAGSSSLAQRFHWAKNSASCRGRSRRSLVS
jgi:superfamily II DNA/RNA helicase